MCKHARKNLFIVHICKIRSRLTRRLIKFTRENLRCENGGIMELFSAALIKSMQRETIAGDGKKACETATRLIAHP
jgi:hypothetical protein